MVSSDDARSPGDADQKGDDLAAERERLDDADEALVDEELTGEGLLPLPDGGFTDDPAPAP
ncbi:hypothetical protein [Herbiconiux sp. L3-i23]|uniref:hypothetical protein n=1 Tax=Herbiconiux sp. L3-i23 TaxID=2905871 RepID=UPI002062C064|nr:hypothetical protein [Herbiconiux sp. L3-i23]BDI22116.1 hypothetical protein L3i23_08920 [Herbiconiux sp. L3-i23]